MRVRPTRKVAILGNYPPRQCGIATFTHSLRNAIVAAEPDWQCPVVTITDAARSYDYPDEVRFEISEDDVQSYVRAADFLNLSRADVLCVQHEFGIYGGAAGGHLGALLRRVRMPIVATLHTVLREPDENQRRIFGQLVECASKLVVMTGHGAEMLRAIHGVPREKIAVIPHGIPDLPFSDSGVHKDRLGIAGNQVLLTFGLLSPGKGIEYAIQALPAIVKRHPWVVYIVLGVTHPRLLRDHGETYRLSLERLARKLGVDANVIFVNRYVSDEDLRAYIGAADIYLTPYLNEAQVTSGTLAYCFGAGKAMVSTPYWHAAELLAGDHGVLVPFRDAQAISTAVVGLLDDESRREAMSAQAYRLGREMTWPRVAQAYAAVIEESVERFQSTATPAAVAATLSGDRHDLPPWRFDHLFALTDFTGVLQHAVFTVPRFEHGYCTDDNARALLLTMMVDAPRESASGIRRVQSSAAAFVHHAFDGSSGRFRNFMSFDRRWLEDVGSEDSHGRALWALGAVVGRASHRGFQGWAAGLFERALPALAEFTSPRAWAFAILGLHEYLRVLDGDLMAHRFRLELAGRLHELFEANAAPDWPWCEDIVAYDNARLPHALILAGRWTENAGMRDCGLRALRWLMDSQTTPDGHFRPVGSNGFWPRGGDIAAFDQQPIEAAAAVSACIEAFNATGDNAWNRDALRAFEWFHGSNDLHVSLYDGGTGGCCDGLHENRVNRNQGAESTLSCLLALAEMRALQNTTASFGAQTVSP